MVFDNPLTGIPVIAVGIALVSQFLQRKLDDRKKMKENQAAIKEKQKTMKELLAKGDDASKKQADALQLEMLQMMNESMQGTMKYMLFSFPLFIGIWWVLGFIYFEQIITLPVALPIMHRDLSFEITNEISWIWWYIYSMLAISLIINLVLKAIDKRKEAAENAKAQ